VSGERRPVRVDSVLTGVLDRYGVREQVERMGVMELWPEIVGEQLAKVTRARAVDDAVLIVEVRNSAWLMELNMMKGDFLERVNARLPEVPMDRIVFVQAETE
jgi:predicted nucleic acid-binding Zn ribbon protein